MAPRDPSASPRQTNIARSLFLVFGGIIAAAQVGKIIVAMPLIQAELQIGLGDVSLLIAVFATLGALFGIAAGLVGRRLGARRCLVGGMTTMALASAAGALAPTIGWLLLARIIEGVGFLAAAVVIPDLLSRAVVEKDRDVMFSLWSAYMPLGGVAMLLVGPWLETLGWRRLWLLCALVAALYALAAALLLREDAAEKPAVEDVRSFLRNSFSVVSDRTFLLLAAGFGLYTAQYFVIAGFLPVLLVSSLHFDLGHASLITTIAVFANAAGNMSAGLLLRTGMSIRANMLIAFGGFAIAAPCIFSGDLPPMVVAGVAAVTLGLGGLVPGSVFAAVPFFAAKRGLVVPAVGLVQQASNMGQFVGPFVAGLVAERFGWPAAPAVLIPGALAGVAIAIGIGKTMQGLKSGAE